jgi:predicted site-specific integrase-resolvase
MTTKNVRQSTGRPVLVLAVDFRRNSKTQITADVKRQFETCEYFAERHKLSPIDFTIINHQHLLQESNEFKVLLDLLQKLNVKTVLIRKSNRLSMTGFFQEEFSKHEISITWVTVNYDRTQNRNFDQTTVVPMIFRSPRNWDFLN